MHSFLLFQIYIKEETFLHKTKKSKWAKDHPDKLGNNTKNHHQVKDYKEKFRFDNPWLEVIQTQNKMGKKKKLDEKKEGELQAPRFAAWVKIYPQNEGH